MVDQTFRILLVEDEPVIRELVSSMLTDGDVTVECAPNGPEGLKKVLNRDYDLILLDVVLQPMQGEGGHQMPMDGITLCRMIKTQPATAGVPLYMLTAKSKKADVEAAQRAGADGYIQKPFRGVELMDLVSKLRRERRARVGQG